MAALRRRRAAGLARLVLGARLNYPFVPTFLLRDRWTPVEDLEGVPGPPTTRGAPRDEVVTAEQGRALFAALRGKKRLWEQPGATHNGLDLRPESPLWDEVVSFLMGGRG